MMIHAPVLLTISFFIAFVSVTSASAQDKKRVNPDVLKDIGRTQAAAGTRLSCRIGGPPEFRDAIVKNNSSVRIPGNYFRIKWEKKDGGKIVGGVYGFRSIPPRGTVRIPTKGGADGTWCQATLIVRR